MHRVRIFVPGRIDGKLRLGANSLESAWRWPSHRRYLSGNVALERSHKGRNEFVELGACDFGLAQLHGTCGIHTVQSKDVLGEIDSNEDNGHDFPFFIQLMRVRTSHRGTVLPVSALRITRDGEVPFIR